MSIINKKRIFFIYSTILCIGTILIPIPFRNYIPMGFVLSFLFCALCAKATSTLKKKLMIIEHI